ncbi:MAG: formimidoylglutamate deiminase [Elusimicrobia bacterium]|nr:MAG: formimidoylglutamate deiminase [Elusimicrobiota bacterium]
MTTLWLRTALLPAGWANHVRIEVSAGRIASVQSDSDRQPEDEGYEIGLPGFCNVHCHAFQRGMAGLAEHRGPGDDDFWSWRDVMYRFLDHLDPDDVEAIAAMAYVEMLETGYTRVGEFHYLHNDANGHRYDNPAEMAERIFAAADSSGIGITMLPVFYAHSDFGGAAPRQGQRRFLNNLDSYAQLYSRIEAMLTRDSNIGIAPHSLRAVTGGELATLLELRSGVPVHIHAAEQTKEVEASLAFSGARPIEWLLANANVNEHWCLIHATHMTDEEAQMLAGSGAVAGLCPITEANLGDGLFPAGRYLSASGRIATGTDSNILIDLSQEMRMLEYGQRLSRRARNLLASAAQPSVGRRLVDEVQAGGAQALGMAAGLAVGNVADIVTLDADHPALCGREGDLILDSWIFAGGTGCIDAVWRAGRKLVAHGRHVERDAVRQRYRKTLKRILEA